MSYFFILPKKKKTHIENWVSPPPKKVTRNIIILPNQHQRLGCLAAGTVWNTLKRKAQGQRASWAKHLSWTYGILGKELVEEGRSRLRRFRQYVRRPGSWMMPSWKEVMVVNGWLTNSGKKKNRNIFGCKESREIMLLSANFTLNSLGFRKDFDSEGEDFFKFCLGKWLSDCWNRFKGCLWQIFSERHGPTLTGSWCATSSIFPCGPQGVLHQWQFLHWRHYGCGTPNGDGC